MEARLTHFEIVTCGYLLAGLARRAGSAGLPENPQRLRYRQCSHNARAMDAHTVCKARGGLLIAWGVFVPPGGLLGLMVVFEMGGGAFQKSLAMLASQEGPPQRSPWLGEPAVQKV